MHRRSVSIAVLLVSLSIAAAQPASLPQRSGGQGKRLIEFGWDEPDTAFMRKHAAQMDATPFDGCVYHFRLRQPDGQDGDALWACWGRQAFTEEQVQHAIDDLKATRFKRLRHNFLRFNVTPADLDWFDDYSAVINNARLSARIAREGGVGILFDTEQYTAQLFDYAKQRDAASKSWEQYAAQARLRGREVMRAFQEGFPGLKVLMTFGYGAPWQGTDGGKQPLSACAYGLLAPFLDGMTEAAEGKTQLIDGWESAYSYFEEKKFVKARKMIHEDILAMVADPQKYRARFSASFGLWLDYQWRDRGWDGENAERNFWTPEKFGAIVSTAMQYADEYVWIYTETPRWWSDEGKPVKLPPAYGDAIRKVASSVSGSANAKATPGFTRIEDVIYGRKFGTALTMDVFTPTEKPNGAAVIWTISGGYVSDRGAIRPEGYAELLRRGYTVFAVVHGSQPKYTIPEALDDMRRAIRFIRHNAERYHIDPQRIGICGGSAGGHLSLMMGLDPQPGKPNKKDPVDREPARVQAVACFFPATDYLNFGRAGRTADDALREELAPFRAPFDFNEFDENVKRYVPITDVQQRLDILRRISPIEHVSPDDPPVLIIHGDADRLVPIEQSQRLVEKLSGAGVTAKLITRAGEKHGWSKITDDVAIFADWFDANLQHRTASQPSPN